MYKREDFDLICPHGHVMKCSYFDSFHDSRTPKPCVLYLHGNSSSRLESYQIIDSILPLNMSLMAFYYPGCGLSEGDWVSLGHYEREDVEKIILFLKKSKEVNSVLLWGRSMGASISIMLSENKSKMIAGILADSPYANLKKLCLELGKKKTSLVKYVFERAWNFMREKIQKAYKFDIDELDIIKFAQRGTVPILILCSKDDEIIGNEHSKALYKAYKLEEKEIVMIGGSHNMVRDRSLVKIGADFLWNQNQRIKNEEYVQKIRAGKRLSLGQAN